MTPPLTESEILCEAAGLIASGYTGTMAFAIIEVTEPDDRRAESALLRISKSPWFTPDGIDDEWKILTLLHAAMEAL